MLKLKTSKDTTENSMVKGRVERNDVSNYLHDLKLWCNFMQLAMYATQWIEMTMV